MSISQKIADFITNPAPFSEGAYYLAIRSIIDTTGAMIMGCCTPAARIALDNAEGTGACTIVGSGEKVSARDAAFINGISGHELELDDTSSSNLGHPTVAVLPALFALGEELHCSGLKLLQAFLIATEVECKIGRICARKLHEKGWHASSITGVIGAAAGSAYLLGLSKEQSADAIGIAASMASGVRENFGTLTKSVHIGKTAEDGLRAAKLASKGVTASKTALEGKEGYFYEYTDFRYEESYLDEIMDSMGNDWDICMPGFTLKRYPSCSSTHRPVDAFIDLVNEEKVKSEEIERIDVKLGKSALRELVTPYPKDGEEAKFSIGFQAALYLHGLDNMPYNYCEDIINRSEIQNIINKTYMQEESEYNDLPSDMGVGPARVVITKKDGTQVSKERIFPVGHLTDPISDSALKTKFCMCTEERLGEKKAADLYELLLSLKDVSDIGKIISMTY